MRVSSLRKSPIDSLTYSTGACAAATDGANMDKHVVIAAAMRTPIGAFQGVLTPGTAPQLGAAAISGALAAAQLDAADVQEVIMGCVLPAGLGQAPARQAALGARIPAGVPSTTIN